MSYATSSKDFYKILRVPHTANIDEIKTAYRKLALRLHPDMHRNDPVKTREFKLVSEAYATLSDANKKHSYDYEFRFTTATTTKHRRTPPPPNYRKVYTARPPPDWKMVWDHELHYRMHYGDGMKDAALKQARADAIKKGEFEYHSPLGKGFAFSDRDPSQNHNPYAKYAVQGPRTVAFEYTESHVDGDRESVRKRERVVEDLHGRRDARHQRQAEQSLRRQQQRHNSAFARRPDDECTIL